MKKKILEQSLEQKFVIGHDLLFSMVIDARYTSEEHREKEHYLKLLIAKMDNMKAQIENSE